MNEDGCLTVIMKSSESTEIWEMTDDDCNLTSESEARVELHFRKGGISTVKISTEFGVLEGEVGLDQYEWEGSSKEDPIPRVIRLSYHMDKDTPFAFEMTID